MKKTTMTIFLICMLSLPFVSSSFAGKGGKGNGNGGGSQGQPGPGATIAALPLEDLSAEEVSFLMLMREEEKLARDVYLTLFEQWDLAIFNNIAWSEQRHMDAVGYLIDKYDELKDPVADDTIGVFSDEGLATLYEDLVDQGGFSEIDALWVGVAIEDLDIGDLIDALNVAELNEDIRIVFENLLLGSVNHYAAFTRLLEAAGETSLAPHHFVVAELEATLSTLQEKGRGGQGSKAKNTLRGRQARGSQAVYNAGELEEITGLVSSVDVGECDRYPSFTLEDGAITIIAGPYRNWIENEFSLAEGEYVSVLAFPSQLLPDVWVAVSITKVDAGGNTLSDPLILRQEQGARGNGNRGSAQGPGNGSGTGDGECQFDN